MAVVVVTGGSRGIGAAVCVAADGAGGMVAQPIPAEIRAKLAVSPGSFAE